MPRRLRSIPPDGRSVVVTGASSGLGRECALHLERQGFTVFPGVRRPQDRDALLELSSAGRLDPVLLDVTDDASVSAAAQYVAERSSELWGVVNNAGICVSAPLECVGTRELRRQFDTNVVGQLSVCRAFLPQLRQEGGRLVNVTSGLGNVAIPYLGAYAAAQFAKEALSDVLRRELRPLGISVSVIQPGAVMTPIWGKVTDQGRDILDSVPATVGALYRHSFLRFLEQNQQQAAQSPTLPEDFARAVSTALTAGHPRTRYTVGSDARMSRVLARALPDRLLDRRLRPLTGPPGSAAPTRQPDTAHETPSTSGSLP